MPATNREAIQSLELSVQVLEDAHRGKPAPEAMKPSISVPADVPSVHDRTAVATIWRFAAYTGLIAGFAALLPVLARAGDMTVFKENGLIEWLQLALLIATVGILLATAGGRTRDRVLLLGLGSLAALAAVREMDLILDAVIPVLGWKIGFLGPVAAAVVAYRQRQKLARQVADYLSTRGMALIWAGFIIAVPFAQLVGHGAFLRLAMGEHYTSDFKRIIEELGELVGYSLIVMGSIETRYSGTIYTVTDRRPG